MEHKSEAGFLAMDALMALAAFVILMPAVMYLWQTGVDYLKKRAVAEHFMMVEQAAKKYGKLNHSTLLALSTATTGPTITVDDLRTTNVLPDYFKEKNAWGQVYKIMARQDTNKNLMMFVVTDGGLAHNTNKPEFANITVPHTAAMARAGFIPTGTTIGSGSTMRGAYGAWEIPLASVGISATAGHLASVSTFSSSDLDQDFLYRISVPGKPELNAMQTELDMTDHAIRGVNELQFTAHAFESLTEFCTTPEDEGRTFLDAEKGLYICRDGKTRVIGDTGNSLLIQDALLATNMQTVEKPLCPAGSGTHPEIFLAPSIVASTAASEEKAPPIASAQTWAVNLSDTEWQVFMRILTAENNWIYPPEDFGRMMVFTSCVRDVETEVTP